MQVCWKIQAVMIILKYKTIIHRQFLGGHLMSYCQLANFLQNFSGAFLFDSVSYILNLMQKMQVMIFSANWETPSPRTSRLDIICEHGIQQAFVCRSCWRVSWSIIILEGKTDRFSVLESSNSIYFVTVQTNFPSFMYRLDIVFHVNTRQIATGRVFSSTSMCGSVPWKENLIWVSNELEVVIFFEIQTIIPSPNYLLHTVYQGITRQIFTG